ncbi:hypothetical protein SJAV_01100 [Sulfurisphaera javensis]|uniref:Uncharacterized protein n=1 Tax=Sulfurisphaera javensis TaxID=2049879 RepID=A0AAT9GMX2_9CREN
MKITIGEIIGILLILAGLSLGFLSATPVTSSHLTLISPSTISKYLGNSWSVNYEYVGSGYYSKIPLLQQYKNSQVVYENLTDSLGDQLIILYVYPYHGSSTIYTNGFTVLYTINKGNAYVMISYIGNSTEVSLSQIESLGNYILSTE